MADQCIVCLDNLDVETNPDALTPTQKHLYKELQEEHERLAVRDPDALNELNKSHERTADDGKEHIARIPICGHMLHDACLKEWSEKANSCPICRQTFHVVTVFDKIGGKFFQITTCYRVFIFCMQLGLIQLFIIRQILVHPPSRGQEASTRIRFSGMDGREPRGGAGPRQSLPRLQLSRP